MFQPKLHPFYNCNTGYKIIIELSKLLYNTDYMVLLPEAERKDKKYFISCTNKIKPLDKITNERFIVFINGQYGLSNVKNLNPNLNNTNWNLYGEKLIKDLNIMKNKLFKGEIAILISYDEDLVIPKVEIVNISIKIDI